MNGFAIRVNIARQRRRHTYFMLLHFSIRHTLMYHISRCTASRLGRLAPPRRRMGFRHSIAIELRSPEPYRAFLLMHFLTP